MPTPQKRQPSRQVVAAVESLDLANHSGVRRGLLHDSLLRVQAGAEPSLRSVVGLLRLAKPSLVQGHCVGRVRFGVLSLAVGG